MHPVLNGRNAIRGLESITIGTLSLDPAFDNATLEYTVNTSNASNKLTVVPLNEESELVIKHNGNVVNNGTSIGWATGENEVIISVDGLEYVINVVRG